MKPGLLLWRQPRRKLSSQCRPTFGSRDSLGIADPDTDGLTRPVY
ncbi:MULTISPECIES: hypothetical protein [Lactobacillus]|nr:MULTISPECIES: hypothetical protein [Lactobacillus]